MHLNFLYIFFARHVAVHKLFFSLSCSLYFFKNRQVGIKRMIWNKFWGQFPARIKTSE